MRKCKKANFDVFLTSGSLKGIIKLAYVLPRKCDNLNFDTSSREFLKTEMMIGREKKAHFKVPNIL